MSKTKLSGLGHYELLFIAPNKFTETEAEAVTKKVEQIIANSKGEITYRENWGKRKFAYPIKTYSHGYYTLLEFDLAGEKLAEFDRFLQLSDDILRHQIVKKKVKSADQVEKEKKISEKIAAKKEAKAKEEKIAEEKQEKAEKEDQGKVDLKDLDEKLDNILNSGDLL